MYWSRWGILFFWDSVSREKLKWATRWSKGGMERVWVLLDYLEDTHPLYWSTLNALHPRLKLLMLISASITSLLIFSHELWKEKRSYPCIELARKYRTWTSLPER